MRHKRPLLTLKNDRIRSNSFKIMPHVLGYINPIAAILLAEDNAFYHRAIIIIGRDFHLPTKNNERLFFCWMPVNRDIRSRLYGIQHPMAFVFQRLMEVIIHPKPRRHLSLF